ncbi:MULTISPECIES: UDP-N-acetylmuramoyl-L-alanyl-D-glutamate--2,6-diaminopimelate ligase [unclassified Shewanella]|uniref:UDP-N-acetylmuramoyl-L-alanyl-D-glutamate--2, 6-diaminopimelate ligase n=1 Tax=unclassified Shewanella TaxID=196818 RepID=UPI0015663E34|nr:MULTISPECIES: UDP-N-acetylmuramoyl-L-alanyl-D-glutamate--2,6-diaminopimelate ligase [unclassified Shewanella]MBW3515800.1 UDP-N-acetylmuramoyl-L-alanyl-D-glutamate--2,6-diaminopimelate ligase [Shewanella sp. NKUCC01_JLK]NRD33621.1 UDP-N-acetylmuramoyl-L-alanyl-D-glutamate--2,6-diaminopimelate ligase [Shewanella sp. DC2-4]
MMLLRDLLAPWLHYAGAQSFNDLTLDSRAIRRGDVFLALPGHKVDGRQFIEKALDLGAAGVLVHTDDADQHGKVLLGDNAEHGVQIYFFQLSRQVSAIAAQRYTLAHKSAVMPSLGVIGITGTNGKTSTSQLIAQLVTSLGRKAAVMGTLGNGLWGELVDSGNTTADAITLMRQLHEFEAQGASVCAMEVSSHGLVQGRVDAVPFDVAVFTNLTRDHLDYHGDMESYAAAKQSLFRFSTLGHGLLNLDDAVGVSWLTELKSVPAQMWGFSIEGHQAAAFYTKNAKFDDQGVSATLVWPEGETQIHSPLLGAFNLSNLLAALSALYLQGLDMKALAEQVQYLTPVAGRMERFTTADNITLVVDYAHTPDAIEQALNALRRHCAGDLWCVFGCGGDRDKGKRPLMGQAAEQYADRIMVTSDNARSEDPAQIITDIIQGLTHPQQALTQVDRIAAIKEVVALAKPGDVILLAGKGHETYQEAAGVRHDYDERALARQLSEQSR